MSVKQAYLAELAAKGFQSDPAQLRAIDALQRCADDWAAYKSKRSNALKKLLNRPDIPKGVYMYGGVGRGKSFLMDCFFNAVPIKRKVRLHFHEFMREVHRELVALQGMVNPWMCWAPAFPSATSSFASTSFTSLTSRTR